MIAGRVLPPGAAVAATAVQAVASGVVLWASLAGRRWLGVGVAAVLLAGVWAGASVSGWAAQQALAGLGHGMLYGGLVFWFGRSLRSPREAVVTQVARRLNPHFGPAMVPYTRGVTAAWCLFGTAQLAASVLLLAMGQREAWALLVGGGHVVLAAALGMAEFAIRCRRFPGEHTGFWDTVRGFRQTD